MTSANRTSVISVARARWAAAWSRLASRAAREPNVVVPLL